MIIASGACEHDEDEKQKQMLMKTKWIFHFNSGMIVGEFAKRELRFLLFRFVGMIRTKNTTWFSFWFACLPRYMDSFVSCFI